VAVSLPHRPDFRPQLAPEWTMPFARNRYALTPPSVVVFVVSLIFAIAAFLVRYAGISLPIINPARVFDVLAIAYVVLAAGVLLRRL
jgi:hypothetical protein